MNVILDFRLHSRARRLTFSSGDLRPVWSPCFLYPISPFYGFTPRQRSALLVFLDAGEGAARPGSGTQNRTRGRDGRMGTTPFAASDEFFPERISLPCLPMAHGFACGVTALHHRTARAPGGTSGDKT